MIDKNKKELIIGGRQSLIHDVIQQLYNFDQSIENMQINKRYNKSPVNHSELNYGPAENTVEKHHEELRQNLDTHHNSQHGANGKALKGSPTSHAQLNKNLLMELESATNQNKDFQLLNAQFDNLIGQNNNFIDETIEVRSNQSSTYPNGAYEGERMGLNDSKSTLDFMLESLS